MLVCKQTEVPTKSVGVRAFIADIVCTAPTVFRLQPNLQEKLFSTFSMRWLHIFIFFFFVLVWVFFLKTLGNFFLS